LLKFSKKTDYALIAMRHMHGLGGEHVSSAREIADRYGISYELVSKILQTLKRKSVIDSVQGAAGGYRLSRNLSGFSLLEFIEMIEGPLGVADCTRVGESAQCVISPECNVLLPMRELNRKVLSVLRETTLESLFKDAGPMPVMPVRQAVAGAV